jgi:hypothetical protein
MRNVVYAINITLDGCCDHTRMIADEEHMNKKIQFGLF